MVSAAAVARTQLRMGACGRDDDRDHRGRPPRNLSFALVEHRSAARNLLRLLDGRSGVNQTWPAGEMAAQFGADLVDPRLALPADERADLAGGREKRSAGRGHARRILSVLLRGLLLGAEIRAGRCGELLLLAGDLTGAAAWAGDAGGRFGIHRDLRPVAGGYLPKADRGGNASGGGFGLRIERRAENAVADIRGAVFCDYYLSADICHDSLRPQEGRQCVFEIVRGGFPRRGRLPCELCALAPLREREAALASFSQRC